MTDEGKSQVDNESAAQDAAKQTTPTQTSEETFDAEYVRKLRAEAADYRKRLRELEGRVKAEEETRMPEQERLQKRTKELEQQVTQYQQSLRYRSVNHRIGSGVCLSGDYRLEPPVVDRGGLTVSILHISLGKGKVILNRFQ